VLNFPAWHAGVVPLTSLLRLLLLAVMWGSSFLWIKIALDGLDPVQITTGRLVLGGGFLLVMCAVMGLKLPRDRALWGHLAFISVVSYTLPFTLFGLAERTVDTGLAGVINATTPLWTALVALLAGQERRPGPMRAAGLTLGFAGTVLILAPWQSAGGSLGGALLCLGAALCYGVSLVYSSRFVVNRGVSPVALAACQIGTAACWSLLAVPVFGTTPVRVDLPIALAVATLGLFGTGYAFVIVNRMLIEQGPTNASTVTYLMPVIAVLLGAVFLDETLGLRVLAGMVVVLVGVMLAQRGPRAITPDAGPPPTGTARTGSTAASCAAPTTRVSPPS
jgi:drug/metabolite transporter (DMT)-like permease